MKRIRNAKVADIPLKPIPATQADIETVCAWMNGGEYGPGRFTAEVDFALCRILDSAELHLQANTEG